MQTEEAQRRIVELEAANSMAEAQVDKLMAFKNQPSEHVDDQVITITADRYEVRSQLDDIMEEYEDTRNSIEQKRMKNGKLSARIQALEEDNKYLEGQFSEWTSKVEEKNDLLAITIKKKSTLETVLYEMMTSSEDSVQLWQERAQSLEKKLEEQEAEAT